MEKIRKYKYIIFIAIILLGFSVYWFQFRPTVKDGGCTFYSPDGNVWRDCVRSDLGTLDKEIANEIIFIKGRLVETTKRLEIRNENLSFDKIPAMLDDYHKKWLDYRNIKCEIEDQDISWGTATEGFINSCKMDESLKYLDELKKLDKKWNVDYEINLDKQ
jgi:uncharacterized protein YecT (DUF1311 family)